MNILCGNVKIETKNVSEDIANLHNSLCNYKEKINEAINYVIPQNNQNLSSQKHMINNSNFINQNISITNLNQNINRSIVNVSMNITENSQHQTIINNRNK